MIRLVFLFSFLKIFNATEDCGVILSGEEFANSGDDRGVKAPWIAAIGKLRNTRHGYREFDVYCSGTILTRKFIITAAHCEFKQALRNSCELLRRRKELYASSGNCIQAHVTACKLRELHASSGNCM